MSTATARSPADGLARRSKPVSAATASSLDVRVWIDRGIEAAWLVAAIVTPLIVLSETSFLSKTELPKVATIRLSAGLVMLLLLLEAGLTVWRRGFTIPSRPYDRVTSAIRGNRGTASQWVMASVIAVVATTGISTAFALLPRLSAWGADPGTGSNSLYSVITYAVLFFAVATRLRNPSQLRRLLGFASDSSFPSGHTLESAAIYGALVIVVGSLIASRRIRLGVWAIGAAIAIGIGASRVYLGVHWASDVAAGWLIGFALVVGIVGLIVLDNALPDS